MCKESSLLSWIGMDGKNKEKQQQMRITITTTDVRDCLTKMLATKFSDKGTDLKQ